MKTLALLLIILIFPVLSFSQIIHIPDDYTTVQQGIDASNDGDTVLVNVGTYLENIDFNGKEIVLGSLFLTTGDQSYITSTIIDGDLTGSVIAFENSETRLAKLIGFTIEGGYAEYGAGIYIDHASPQISFNIIAGNEALLLGGEFSKGGGIYCNESDALVDNNVISNNYCSGPFGGLGGGIYIDGGAPKIKRNTISNNLGDWNGGGIYCSNADPMIQQNLIFMNRGTISGGGIFLDNASPLIINNTLTGNYAKWEKGGGLYCDDGSSPMIVNTIFWQDMSFEDMPEIYVADGVPQLMYCNVEGGWDGVGNLDEYPWFRDPEQNDYHLMAVEYGFSEDSPMIDAGHPFISDSKLDSLWGLGTIDSDMGAYGGGGDDTSQLVGIHDFHLQQNSNCLQVFPNPITYSARFDYSINQNSNITIQILDLNGKQLIVIVNEFQKEGKHQVMTNLGDLMPGIYICRMKTNEGILNRKIIKH